MKVVSTLLVVVLLASARMQSVHADQLQELEALRATCNCEPAPQTCPNVCTSSQPQSCECPPPPCPCRERVKQLEAECGDDCNAAKTTNPEIVDDVSNAGKENTVKPQLTNSTTSKVQVSSGSASSGGSESEGDAVVFASSGATASSTSTSTSSSTTTTSTNTTRTSERVGANRSAKTALTSDKPVVSWEDVDMKNVGPEARVLLKKARVETDRAGSKANALGEQVAEVRELLDQEEQHRLKLVHAEAQHEVNSVRGELGDLESKLAAMKRERESKARKEEQEVKTDERQDAYEKKKAARAKKFRAELQAKHKKDEAEHKEFMKRYNEAAKKHRGRVVEYIKARKEAELKVKRFELALEKAKLATADAARAKATAERKAAADIARAQSRHLKAAKAAREAVQRAAAKYKRQMDALKAEEEGRKKTRAAHAKRMAEMEKAAREEREAHEEDRKHHSKLAEQKHKTAEEDRKAALRAGDLSSAGGQAKLREENSKSQEKAAIEKRKIEESKEKAAAAAESANKRDKEAHEHKMAKVRLASARATADIAKAKASAEKAKHDAAKAAAEAKAEEQDNKAKLAAEQQSKERASKAALEAKKLEHQKNLAEIEAQKTAAEAKTKQAQAESAAKQAKADADKQRAIAEKARQEKLAAAERAKVAEAATKKAQIAAQEKKNKADRQHDAKLAEQNNKAQEAVAKAQAKAAAEKTKEQNAKNVQEAALKKSKEVDLKEAEKERKRKEAEQKTKAAQEKDAKAKAAAQEAKNKEEQAAKATERAKAEAAARQKALVAATEKTCSQMDTASSQTAQAERSLKQAIAALNAAVNDAKQSLRDAGHGEETKAAFQVALKKADAVKSSAANYESTAELFKSRCESCAGNAAAAGDVGTKKRAAELVAKAKAAVAAAKAQVPKSVTQYDARLKEYKEATTQASKVGRQYNWEPTSNLQVRAQAKKWDQNKAKLLFTSPRSGILHFDGYGTGGWVEINNPTPLYMTSASIMVGGSGGDWRIQYLDEDTGRWVTVRTTGALRNGWNTFSWRRSGASRYWRWLQIKNGITPWYQGLRWKYQKSTDAKPYVTAVYVPPAEYVRAHAKKWEPAQAAHLFTSPRSGILHYDKFGTGGWFEVASELPRSVRSISMFVSGNSRTAGTRWQVQYLKDDGQWQTVFTTGLAMGGWNHWAWATKATSRRWRLFCVHNNYTPWYMGFEFSYDVAAFAKQKRYTLVPFVPANPMQVRAHAKKWIQERALELFKQPGRTGILHFDKFGAGGYIEVVSDKPIFMVESSLQVAAACCSWEIQYLNEARGKWVSVHSTGRLSAGWNTFAWGKAGASRFWRWFMIHNTGTPWYTGLKWKFIKDQTGQYQTRRWNPQSIGQITAHAKHWKPERALQLFRNPATGILHFDGFGTGGWVRFDNPTPLAMVSMNLFTAAYQGDGRTTRWRVQRLRRNKEWETVYTSSPLTGYHHHLAWGRKGASKSWRIMCFQNSATPWYNFFEWTYDVAEYDYQRAVSPTAGKFTAPVFRYWSGWNFAGAWHFDHYGGNQMVVGDFNGDGRTDYGHLGPTYIHFFISKGDGQFWQPIYPFPRGWNFGWNEDVWTNMGQGFDFSGDGRTDILRTYRTYNHGFISKGSDADCWSRNLWVPHACMHVTTYRYPGGWNFHSHWRWRYPAAVAGADFNRDGRMDYARIGPTYIHFFISVGNGQFYSPIYPFPSGWNFGWNEAVWTTLKPADYNGDGTYDIIRTSARYHHGFYATLNDAGCWRRNGWISRSCMGVTTFHYPHGWNFVGGWAWTWRAALSGPKADFNGDGLADFARLGGTYIHFFISQGNGKFYYPIYPFPKGWNFGHNENGWTSLPAGDYDGNGQGDVIRTSARYNHGFFAQGSQERCWRRNGWVPNDCMRVTAYHYPHGWNFHGGWTWNSGATIAGDFAGSGQDSYINLRGGTYHHAFHSVPRPAFKHTSATLPQPHKGGLENFEPQGDWQVRARAAKWVQNRALELFRHPGRTGILHFDKFGVGGYVEVVAKEPLYMMESALLAAGPGAEFVVQYLDEAAGKWVTVAGPIKIQTGWNHAKWTQKGASRYWRWLQTKNEVRPWYTGLRWRHLSKVGDYKSAAYVPAMIGLVDAHAKHWKPSRALELFKDRPASGILHFDNFGTAGWVSVKSPTPIAMIAVTMFLNDGPSRSCTSRWHVQYRNLRRQWVTVHSNSGANDFVAAGANHWAWGRKAVSTEWRVKCFANNCRPWYRGFEWTYDVAAFAEQRAVPTVAAGKFTWPVFHYWRGWNFVGNWHMPRYNGRATVVGDFNGDGRSDYCKLGATYIHFFISKGNGKFWQPIYPFPKGWNFGWNEDHWTTMPIGDMDGDGKTDLLRTYHTYNHGFLNRGSAADCWNRDQWISNGCMQATTYRYPHGWNFHGGWNWRAPAALAGADFNGDGRMDYVRVGPTYAHFFISQGNGQFYYPIYPYPKGWNFGTNENTWTTLKAADYTGTGVASILRTYYTYNHMFTPIIRTHSQSQGSCWYRNGWIARECMLVTTFHYPHGWSFSGGWRWTWGATQVGDFNGDGAVDYARLGGTYIHFFIANPDKPGAFHTPVYPFPKGWNFGHDENTWATLKTADFDRNGQADLIRTSARYNHGFYAQGTDEKCWRRSGTIDRSCMHVTTWHYPHGWNFAGGWNWNSHGNWLTTNQVVADFSGDGQADYANLYAGTYSHQFYQVTRPPLQALAGANGASVVPSFQKHGEWALEQHRLVAYKEQLNHNGAFTVSFWILAKGKLGGWRQVLCKGDGGHRRMPCIWFHPDQTRLHIRSSTTKGWNTGLDPARHMPIGQWVHVTVRHKAGSLQVFYDGQSVGSTNLPAPQNNNDALYTSLHANANADMAELKWFRSYLSDADVKRYYEMHKEKYGGEAPAYKHDGRFAVKQGRRLASAGVVKNKDQYTLSFWVKPKGKLDGWRQVIVKGDGNHRRAPGVWFYPGQTRLHIRSSSANGWNTGADPAQQLPIGQWVHVTVRHRNGALEAFYNGKRVSHAGIAGPTVNSDDLYASLHAHANADLGHVRWYNRFLTDAQVMAEYRTTRQHYGGRAQAGTFRLPAWGSGQICREVRFHSAFAGSDPVYVQATIDHRTYSGSGTHDSLMLWLEWVRRDRFKVCLRETAHHGSGGHDNNAHVTWFASTGGALGGTTGELRFPSWGSGISCRRVEFPAAAPSDDRTRVVATVNHRTYNSDGVHDSVGVWVQDVHTTNARVCVRESRHHGSGGHDDNLHVSVFAFDQNDFDVPARGRTRVANWSGSQTCVWVSYGKTFGAAPFVQATHNHVHYKSSGNHDASTGWIDQVEKARFRYCIRELAQHDGPHDQAYVDWFATDKKVLE